MLYVTTRSKFDTYTVHRANQSDRGPDGGLYLPFRLPKLEKAEVLALCEQPFSNRIAQIVNLFFGTQLTGWDVELCGGKSPVRLVPMSHRIVVAEAWHSHDMDLSRFAERLSARICNYEDAMRPVTSWMGIAVRIAVLFATYAQLLATDAARFEIPIDIAVAADDFAAPMAVWYAREMGLPVANIVCSHDNSSVWDLIHHGEVRTEIGMPENLERLIFATLGVEENLRYCEICESGKLYATKPGMLEQLRKGMYAAVVSTDRVEALIPSVYRACGYILGPGTASAYGGLQDYRARSGENRLALLLSEKSPALDGEQVADGLGMSVQQLQEQLGE